MLGDLLRESFPGFEKDALKFLTELKNPAKNNKEWFDKNRDSYEILIREPMKHLIDTLAEKINKSYPDIVVNYKSIFRINRDIRFSKDKRPYKTHVAAAFAFDRIKSAEIPQFYFHFSPEEFLFAAGQYSMDPEYLKKIRRFIFANFSEYRKIVTNARFRRRFGSVQGEALSSLPKEFAADPATVRNKNLAEVLKMKQFYVFETDKPDVVLREKISDRIVDNIGASRDFTLFLTEAIR